MVEIGEHTNIHIMHTHTTALDLHTGMSLPEAHEAIGRVELGEDVRDQQLFQRARKFLCSARERDGRSGIRTTQNRRPAPSPNPN